MTTRRAAGDRYKVAHDARPHGMRKRDQIFTGEHHRKASLPYLAHGSRRMASSSPSALVVRLDAIGDALAVTPMIAALREGGIPVAAVLRPTNADVFSRRALDERYVATFPQRNDSAANRSAIARFAADLRGHYTHGLIATEDVTGYRLAYDARIPLRIGFENGWGKPFKTLWVRRMCTQTVYRAAGLDPKTRHECQVVFELARPLLGEDAQPTRNISALRSLVLDEEPAADARVALQVTDKWQRLGQPLEAVIELAQRIARRHELRCIASSSEAAFADRFEASARITVERFDTLPAWKSAIAAARAYVAPDSGGLHVAGMVGTPVVAAYEAMPQFAAQTARWAPWAAPHRLIEMQGEWPLIAADALDGLLNRRNVYTG